MLECVMLRWKEVEEERGVEIQHHGLVYGGWRICRIFGLRSGESVLVQKVTAGKSKIRMNPGSHDLDHGTALLSNVLLFSSYQPGTSLLNTAVPSLHRTLNGWLYQCR